MKKSEAKNLKVGELVVRTAISNDLIYEVKDIVWDDEGIPTRITLHFVESIKFGKPLFTNNNDDCLTYRRIRYLTDDERAELVKQRIIRANKRLIYRLKLMLLRNKAFEES